MGIIVEGFKTSVYICVLSATSFINAGPIPFVTLYTSVETVNFGGEFSQTHPDIPFVTRDNVGYLFLYLFVGYGTSKLKGNTRIEN